MGLPTKELKLSHRIDDAALAATLSDQIKIHKEKPSKPVTAGLTTIYPEEPEDTANRIFVASAKHNNAENDFHRDLNELQRLQKELQEARGKIRNGDLITETKLPGLEGRVNLAGESAKGSWNRVLATNQDLLPSLQAKHPDKMPNEWNPKVLKPKAFAMK